MAAVAPPADQAADLLKNISLDSQTKTSEIPEPTKKPAVENGNGQLQPSNKSVTPLVPDFIDPAMAYYPNPYAATAYYYGGYDGTNNDWDDLAHGVYGYGFAPYGPYSPAVSPVPTVGHDGQVYGAQHYQYSSPYFPPSTPTGGPYPASAAPTKVETTTPAAADQKPSIADQKPSIADTTKGNSNGVGTKGNNGSASLRPNATNGSYGSAQNGFYDPRYSFDGLYSPIPWLNGPMYSDPKTRNNTNNGVASKNQNVNSHLMNPRPMPGMTTGGGYMNRLYPNKLYGPYGNTYRSGYGYGYASNAYDLPNNGRGWSTIDNKYKTRGRGYGFFGYNNENGDGLNELNRGPRARITKNQKVFTPIAIAVKGQNVILEGTDGIVKETKEVNLSPDREQFNKPEFPLTYSDAKFFIIKSYSEDDVHKSIKYNVWASTPNGNKKLDAAYQEAQEKSEVCPVFLFFSVNTSGQFVGVAEMVGQVDFNKSLEYWQQDKWIGCFPVNWHIVKDLPNSLLKHIILENNENKPVTNSRDTQEVKLEQGLEMIKIFKEHCSKQCILDDFEFYEDRQKKIQEKKAKQQQFQKQAWEGKLAIDEKSKDSVKAEVLPPKVVDVADLVNEVKLADSVQDISKPAEMVVVNCVAKSC